MNQSIAEMQSLLQEIIALLQSGSKAERRKAARQLQSIATIATTASLAITVGR